MMSHEHDAGDLDALRAEIEAAERRVAREIEPGARALVVAILVFVLLGSFILPHTGSVRGWDVLFSSHGAGRAAVALPSRVFAWLALVFGVGFSMLALLTRRWALAWVALAGSAMASGTGLLAVWSRQTPARLRRSNRRRAGAVCFEFRCVVTGHVSEHGRCVFRHEAASRFVCVGVGAWVRDYTFNSCMPRLRRAMTQNPPARFAEQGSVETIDNFTGDSTSNSPEPRLRR